MQEIAGSIHAPPRGERLQLGTVESYGVISIHAPREGSDRWRVQQRVAPMNFNPRSP